MKIFIFFLIEVRVGMLHDSEYDGLGRGEEEGGQPGNEHHKPGVGVTCYTVDRAVNRTLPNFTCPQEALTTRE